MKKLLFLTFLLSALLGIAGLYYTGPKDGRLAPDHPFRQTLGFLAQEMDVIALADVIEVSGPTPLFSAGYIKVRIVNAVYGCTNGQEVIIRKHSVKPPSGSGDVLWGIEEDPLYEYFPTNNSRIVFAGSAGYIKTELIYNPETMENKLIDVLTGESVQFPRQRDRWEPKDWKVLPQPEVIIPVNKACALAGFTRSWWYDGWQENLPYAHLTNLVRAAQVERNWTNFYHIVRDAVPTPASPRVWQDSWHDLVDLALPATQPQYEYMLNDPLYPAEAKDRLINRKKYIGEDD